MYACIYICVEVYIFSRSYLLATTYASLKYNNPVFLLLLLHKATCLSPRKKSSAFNIFCSSSSHSLSLSLSLSVYLLFFRFYLVYLQRNYYNYFYHVYYYYNYYYHCYYSSSLEMKTGNAKKKDFILMYVCICM